MVFPLVGAVVAATPTVMAIGSKVLKHYGKFGRTPIAQAAQFGLGYGASTAIGYNLVPQFGRRNTNNVTKLTIGRDMPYGRYYPRRNRYGYSTRYGGRYSRRYSRYGRRSYYGRRYY